MLFSVNINHNFAEIKNSSIMKIVLELGVDDKRITEIENQIKSMDMVKDCRLETKEEGLEILKSTFGDNEDLLEGLDDDEIIPRSIIVHLRSAQYSSTVAEWLKTAEGVDVVLYPFEKVRDLIRVERIIKIFTSIIILVLMIISTFIISNTIKITVFARRKEINIMKYIGATDAFIRWPFIIQGIIIGLIGCIVAFAILGYSYTSLANYVFAKGELKEILPFAVFLPFENISNRILIVFLVIGSGIGALGSGISIRKYLCV